METGKHYNYYRDFDPSLGRYIESDPIGLAGGINTYAYVYWKPLSLVDRDGLVAGPASEPDPDSRWKPDPRDWYPEPAPDGKCMLLCLAIDFAAGHGLLKAAGGASNFASGSSNAGARVLGAIGGIGATALGHTPPGKIVELGLGMRGCEKTCRKPKYCEIPDWAKPYQNIPLPPLSTAFPR